MKHCSLFHHLPPLLARSEKLPQKQSKFKLSNLLENKEFSAVASAEMGCNNLTQYKFPMDQIRLEWKFSK